MPSSKKKKAPASGTIAPRAVTCQAEPERIPPEEVLPPEENPQALPPEETLQTQEPDEAEMPEEVQRSLNPDEQSERSSLSEDTPPVWDKGKAVLHSATWKPLPLQEDTLARTGHSRLPLDDGPRVQLTTSGVVRLPDMGDVNRPGRTQAADPQPSTSRQQLPDSSNRLRALSAASEQSRQNSEDELMQELLSLAREDDISAARAEQAAIRAQEAAADVRNRHTCMNKIVEHLQMSHRRSRS
jgi:hypothetical protein